MFNFYKNRENGDEIAKKRPETSFFEQILFLSKIQHTIYNYNVLCDNMERFYGDLHVFVEVDNNDITKRKEKTIDEQSNSGARHHGVNKSRRAN